YDAALVQEGAAFAEGQLVDPGQFQILGVVESSDRFLQSPVIDVLCVSAGAGIDAGAIGVGEGLLERIADQKREALREAARGHHLQRVVVGVPEVREVVEHTTARRDTRGTAASKLRIGQQGLSDYRVRVGGGEAGVGQR